MSWNALVCGSFDRKRGVLPALRIGFALLLALLAMAPAFAQSEQQVAKAREEWALTDQQLSERQAEAHAFEEDWSRGMWVVRKPLFFSDYKDVDDYLSGRKIPNAANARSWQFRPVPAGPPLRR